MATPTDLDSADGLKVFRGAYDTAKDHQDARDNQCERDYQNFHAVIDEAGRNPDLAHIALPKIYSIVMTKYPKEVRAAIGRRPYIPFDARREEYQDYAQLQQKFLDQILYEAGYYNEFVLGDLMKMVYGTAFVEAMPYFREVIQQVPVPEIVETWRGPQVAGYRIESVKKHRFGLILTTYAPWEVKVDPHAKNLEILDGCRYVVKIRICSKRTIRRLAESGAYGDGFDVEKLDMNEYDDDLDNHRGLEILESIGLVKPEHDSDIGVLYRYESPERYIDVWNDRVVLRDYNGNPFSRDKKGHGLINLSRMIHNVDPHTQARFWGNGEVKILEVLSALHNDLFNLAINNHNFMGQGKTYFGKGRGVSPEQLVHQLGNKVGFDLKPGDDIKRLVFDDYGQPLPPEHYALREIVENMMDMTARSFEVSRGEGMKGAQTASEIAMLREAGDSGQEMNVKNLEDPFMKDFGYKCLCHIDQFARQEDKADILGEEAANSLMFMHPQDLPGGYDFMFKGSDRVVNQVIKQQNLDKLDERIGENPYVKQRERLEILLEVNDLGDEKERLLKTEEEMMMELQQRAMAETQKMEQESTSKTDNSIREKAATTQLDIAKQQGEASKPEK